MKKWLIYVLGIITGVILTFAFAFCINLSNNSGIIDLKCLKNPEIIWNTHNLGCSKW